MKKNFLAIFTYDTPPNENTCCYDITFPGIPGALSCGDSYEDCLYMATDCLECYFSVEKKEFLEYMLPTENIKLKENQIMARISVEVLIEEEE